MPTHKKHCSLYRYLVRIGASMVVLIPHSVSAAAITFPTSVTNTASDMMSSAIAALHMITWVAFAYLNTLLDPRFIFDLDEGGGDGSLMNTLNQVWILARDLVNVAFAVILVVAAVAVMITQKKDIIAPYWSKFVMAVILVNFSWFFPRVIIDVANVAAATVYSIPSLVGADNCNVYASEKTTPSCTEITPDRFKCPCTHVTNVLFFLDEADYKKVDGATGWECILGNVLCIKKEELKAESVAGYSYILNGLIVNHSRLQTLAALPPPVSGASVSFVVMMRFALILFLHVALAFPLLAMLLAFFMRIPVLWFTMAFMPFVFLKFVVPEKYLGGLPDKLWDYFLKAAFLPAIVAIPLCIGFIMINAGSAIAEPNLEGVSINLFDDISNYWQILWLIMSIGVIWVGVFSMLEKMGGIAVGAKAIQGVGKTLGGIAVKAPLSIPSIPGLNTSILGLGSTLRGVNAGLSSGRTWEDLRGGGAARIGTADAGGQRLKEDDGARDALTTALEGLSNTMRQAGGSTEVQRSSHINNVNAALARVNIAPVTDQDVHTRIRELIVPMRTHGANNASVNQIEGHVAAIEGVRNNPPNPTP